MDSKGLLLRLTLDALRDAGVFTNIDNLEGRKNVQKSLYLLQENRLPYGYFFGWYLRGPYSSGLANDYFKVAEDQSDRYTKLAKDKTLSESIRDKIKQLVSLLKSDNWQLKDQLEAAASARFIMVSESRDAQSSVAELRKRKPGLPFDEGKVLACLNSLEPVSDARGNGHSGQQDTP